MTERLVKQKMQDQADIKILNERILEIEKRIQECKDGLVPSDFLFVRRLAS
jgi:hypothetical protein